MSHKGKPIVPTAEPLWSTSPQRPQKAAQPCSHARMWHQGPRQAGSLGSEVKPSRGSGQRPPPLPHTASESATESQPLYPEPTPLNRFPDPGEPAFLLSLLSKRTSRTPGGMAFSLPQPQTFDKETEKNLSFKPLQFSAKQISPRQRITTIPVPARSTSEEKKQEHLTGLITLKHGSVTQAPKHSVRKGLVSSCR